MTETRDARSRGFDFRAVNQAVINEYRATGGKLEKTLAGSRLLLLTTVGERTGRPHTIPLGYVPQGANPAPADGGTDPTDQPDQAADRAETDGGAGPGGGPDPAGGTVPAATLRAGGGLVVYASNMAAAGHPQWYRNLLAQPKVTIELGTERFDAQAVTAVGPERAALYAALAEGMPGIRTHQEQTEREIPVVVLTPLR